MTKNKKKRKIIKSLLKINQNFSDFISIEKKLT